MNAIVVVDRNWAIGREGGLLFTLPTDMKRFKDLTMGGTIIMGRKTLESFPGGKLLILPIPRVASPEPDLTPYREIIRTEAAAFPTIPMRDGYDFFPAKAELYIDGTHPNDAGAKIYADFLTQTIKQGA